MSDPAAAVQTAIIAALRGDTTLQGLMAPAVSPEWNIFDQGGSGQITPSFPYVYVHPVTAGLGAALAMGKDAMALYVQVSVFTKTEGFAQARGIAARCYSLLQGPLAGALTLSGGFTNVLTLFQNRQELEQVEDGLIQHIADRYHFEIQG